MIYDKIEDSNEKLFNKVLDGTSIPKTLTIQLIAANEMKDIGKVVRASDLVRYVSDGVDVFVILNETIFDRLDDDQQKLILEELLAQIYVDPESGKLKLLKPDISTFSLLLTKYGIDFYLGVKETISSIINELEATEE